MTLVDRTDYRANADKDSATFLIWADNVIGLAGVTFEASTPYRDRMMRAYTAGEPVWMMADELRQRIPAAKRALRSASETRFLRSIVAA